MSFDFMAAITICSHFGTLPPPQKIKSLTVSTVSPSIYHEVMGPDAMILVFWMLSFKPTFSLSSFTFIKRLFSSYSLSAIRVVSSAYLRLLIFLPAILIPACASSSPAFLMMYSECKLNKQGDNIQPWRTPFPIWNQSVVPCPDLTVLPDLHTDFSRGRSGGLAFPSLSEFSRVCGDPHSQRFCCQGPVPAGSRSTLRMNGIGEKKERGRERERPDWGVCSRVWQRLIFTVAFIPKVSTFLRGR